SVTFWGDQRNHPGDENPSTDLLAFALIIGDGRYPRSEGQSGGLYLSGRIASLEPDVKLRLTGGETIKVIIPAQVPIARLVRASRSDDAITRNSRRSDITCAIDIPARAANGEVRYLVTINQVKPFAASFTGTSMWKSRSRRYRSGFPSRSLTTAVFVRPV